MSFTKSRILWNDGVFPCSLALPDGVSYGACALRLGLRVHDLMVTHRVAFLRVDSVISVSPCWKIAKKKRHHGGTENTEKSFFR